MNRNPIFLKQLSSIFYNCMGYGVVLFVVGLFTSYVHGTLSLNLGHRFGSEVTRYSIFPYVGTPLSELSFYSNSAPFISVKFLKDQSTSKIKTKGYRFDTYGIDLFVTKSTGWFEDKDFDIGRESLLQPITTNQLDIYSRADLNSKSYRMFLHVGKTVFQRQHFRFNLQVGYLYSNLVYSVFNADQWSLSNVKVTHISDKIDTSHAAFSNPLHLSGEVLRYKLTNQGPILGVRISSYFKRFHWDTTVLWTPLVTITDRDDHLLVNKVSQSVHEGTFVNMDIGMTYLLDKNWAIFSQFKFMHIYSNSGYQTQRVYSDSSLDTMISEVNDIPHSIFRQQYGLEMGIRYRI